MARTSYSRADTHADDEARRSHVARARLRVGGLASPACAAGSRTAARRTTASPSTSSAAGGARRAGAARAPELGRRLWRAKRKPREGTDADDKAGTGTSTTGSSPGERHGVEVLFTIFGPSVGERRAAADARRAAPSRCGSSPYAAATLQRHLRPRRRCVPRVRYWTAWNEPNLQIGLVPQWRRVGGTDRPERDRLRADLKRRRGDPHVDAARPEGCLRGHRGVATTTRGRQARPPLAFLRALKKAGATGFDAYAHHPRYGGLGDAGDTSPGRGGVSATSTCSSPS